MREHGHVNVVIALLCSLLLLPGCATLGQQAGKTEASVAKKSEKNSALYAKAEEALSQGKSSDALFYYQEILKAEPRDREALIRCGGIYLDVGLPELAENHYARVLEIDADDMDALEGRGFSRIKLHQYGKARSDLQRASALDAKRWNAWNGLGVIADMEGQYDLAGEYYRKGLEVLPNYPPLINNLGYSLIMAHRYQEAERVLRSGLLYDPDFLRLKNNLGIALAWQGKYRQALDTLAPAIGEALAYNNVGYIAMLREDYEKATQYFELALKSSPNYYLRAAQNLDRVRQLLEKSQ